MERWCSASLLGDAGVLEIAHQALRQARGRALTGAEYFHATLWLGGAEDTFQGRKFLGTIADFVHVLRERATKVAPKGTGWVIEPTINPRGRRTNAETYAVHALFLDNDGTGNWDQLLKQLNALNYCYIAYQSGGYTPALPKWRIIFPLQTPHETKTKSGIATWKSIYNHARVVFGAVAGLFNVGFDPATETPCCPWFLTERRERSHPERQIIWHPGHALDLTSLILALPPPPEESSFEYRGAPAELALGDTKLNALIDDLVKVMSNVPTGRRDLYLALPGTLLSRGVVPDDVLAVIEAVSSSYPRRHPEKHADNMHNCETTIARWEAKDKQYTQIGTLQSIAPSVAAVIDKHLPDRTNKAILDATDQILHSQTVSVSPEAASQIIERAVTAARQPRGKQTPIQKDALKAAKLFHSWGKEAIANLIECVVKCLPIIETPEASVDKQVAILMDALGQQMPNGGNEKKNYEWTEVLDMCNPSLLDFTASVERVAAAERAFYTGRGKRNRYKIKMERKARGLT
jgi:hypothetical protein